MSSGLTLAIVLSVYASTWQNYCDCWSTLWPKDNWLIHLLSAGVYGFFWLCTTSSWGFMSLSVHMVGRRAEINLSTFLESPSLFFKIRSLIGLRIRLSWLTSVLQRPAHLFILMLGSQVCATRPGFQYISQNMKNRKDFNLLRKFLQCLNLEP